MNVFTMSIYQPRRYWDGGSNDSVRFVVRSRDRPLACPRLCLGGPKYKVRTSKIQSCTFTQPALSRPNLLNLLRDGKVVVGRKKKKKKKMMVMIKYNITKK